MLGALADLVCSIGMLHRVFTVGAILLLMNTVLSAGNNIFPFKCICSNFGDKNIEESVHDINFFFFKSIFKVIGDCKLKEVGAEKNRLRKHIGKYRMLFFLFVV